MLLLQYKLYQGLNYVLLLSLQIVKICKMKLYICNAACIFHLKELFNDR